ncbi:DksA-like zinc finger domain containing protein [uncultured Caudovirales phage]|uniref:DksA-like zinc finger domain containing protein n=1 Tax=uncultured Caudovirales phage TaxID=2100421 RepID=A0A6J5L1I0_9CAUD|nr:DksA-like zinc finger domain containing protein [uncultured Caudovirales phage]
MADAADEAEAIESVQMAARLAYVRRQAAAPPSDGRCVTCGEPIAPARLQALPSARQCIGCASR